MKRKHQDEQENSNSNGIITKIAKMVSDLKNFIFSSKPLLTHESDASEESAISSIPPEMLAYILSFLPVQEFLTLSLVNHQFKDAVEYLSEHGNFQPMDDCDDDDEVMEEFSFEEKLENGFLSSLAEQQQSFAITYAVDEDNPQPSRNDQEDARAFAGLLGRLHLIGSSYTTHTYPYNDALEPAHVSLTERTIECSNKRDIRTFNENGQEVIVRQIPATAQVSEIDSILQGVTRSGKSFKN